jgi:metal transporter CNNM
MAPFVLILMWIMFPVAWPTAKLLDYLLGADHGTMYKKAGLKTLVSLHKTLGTTPGERLMEDEVTIINSVLDLKEKPVGDIMTPMQDVFTMSADTVLDERMMDTVLSQGYSRIPIYAPDNNQNFIGMLLVKILITYDPEDGKRVRDFSLATLPETAPYTSCLDIINFFQEGKSHMVLVSDFPGQDQGAIGVVTLEDVIEELIGEEIIDESDVFIDVHKAIRRMAPAPRQRFFRHSSMDPAIVADPEHHESKEDGESEPLLRKETNGGSRKPSLTNGNVPPTTFLMRRKSSTASDSAKDNFKGGIVPVRSDVSDVRDHLRHLGPSNAASRPKPTKFTSVKIKPGVGTIPENKATTKGVNGNEPILERSKSVEVAPQLDESGSLLRSAGKDASDGAAALRAGYGTMSAESTTRRRERGMSADGMSAGEASRIAEENASPNEGRLDDGRENQHLKLPSKTVVGDAPDDEGQDNVGQMEAPSRDRSKNRRQARSGSITETTVDIGGMKKVVLETGSSSDDEEEEGGKGGDGSPKKKDGKRKS